MVTLCNYTLHAMHCTPIKDIKNRPEEKHRRVTMESMCTSLCINNASRENAEHAFGAVHGMQKHHICACI